MDSFNLTHVGLANLSAIDGFNPITFSFLGMLIVFCGLTFISLYITALPKILVIREKYHHGKDSAAARVVADTSHEQGEESHPDEEILLAIAIAFHLDQDFPEEKTWKMSGDEESAWLASGIAHALAIRNHVHISRRRY